MAESRALYPTKVPEIRKGDTVVLLRGKDAGKRGVVDRVLRNPVTMQKTRSGWKPASSRPLSVVVSGLNIAKKHTKPRMRSGQSDRVPQAQQGGILDVAQPIAIGNVMLVCPHCEKPTRIAHAVLESGQRVRVCHHCGEQLEVRS
jgi:large subunit ribosomal protein L24